MCYMSANAYRIGGYAVILAYAVQWQPHMGYSLPHVRQGFR